MAKRNISIHFIIIMIVISWSNIAISFDEITTHPLLTIAAIDYDEYLSNYLNKYLSIDLKNTSLCITDAPDDISPIEYERFYNLDDLTIHKYDYNSSFQLSITGSRAEDYPNLPFKYPNIFTPDPLYFKIGGSRASHHFHDPLNTLRPGLENREAIVTPLVRRVTHNLNDLSGISAGNRAAGLTRPPFGFEIPDRAVPKNYFSWSDARRYYRLALTSMLEQERSHYFALTFLALGHLMHLAEDMAVPSHTRNDMAWDHIYTLAKLWTSPNFENYVTKYKSSYIKSLTGPDIPSVDQTDLPSFWDHGGNLPLGLAEYTQPSFLSLNTVFNQYAQPDFSLSDLHFEFTFKDTWMAYMSGRTIADEPIEHLARFTASSVMRSLILSGSLFDVRKYLTLDQACYEDYANLLLPRAVAYASGVLKHFFRGKLGAYLNTDGKLMIINQAQDEMEGTFSLYYDSTLAPGVRFPLGGAIWTLTIPPGESRPLPDEFTLPQDMDKRAPLTLVFQGRLGGETDAVAGLVFHLPNAIRVWKIDHSNDDSRFLYEAYDNPEYVACWVTWERGRYLFNRTGLRTVYYILSLYHDPAGGDPILLPGGLKARATLLPYSSGSFTYSFPGTQNNQEDFYRKAFTWTGNSCNDPTVLAILSAMPGWKHVPQNPNYLWADRTSEVLPWTAPLSYQEVLIPSVLPYIEIAGILDTLHPWLNLRNEMRKTGAVYALLTIPIPDPETYEISDNHSVGVNPDYGFDSSYVVEGYIPEIWGLGGVSFINGLVQPVPLSGSYSNYVYGPDFQRTVEWRLDSYHVLDRWTYNPSDPFMPLYTSEE